MSDWHQAKVMQNEPAADGLFHLTVDVRDTPLPEGHRLPGQYVKLAVDGVGEGYFAIASAPGGNGKAANVFEFLVKEGSALTNALKGLKVGERLKISAPAGKGFPLERARGKDVLLFATGSGIGAIRSVIEEIRRVRKEYGDVTLFFGVRTPASFAYAAELDAWERDGIKVIRTVSRPGNSGWQGLTGYVQAHVGEVRVSNAVAFLVGQKGMVEGVTEALVSRGLPRENLFLNF